ncbi:PEP-CTERM sorting domain-containing protein [uncultured Phenylobacterium sp.]|uniref:PEP-CTERM sorting domain-containing protein n=1 Tax=uncultured Phenylobacterium sp. TaxID=349273 RepID=UPI0025DC5C79|nr:PEP-CTERM sorting domain-containing protein [uncultured Phenylobacterium sp.]
MHFKALIVAGAIALAGLLAPVSASTAELLANGSFEHGLDGWTPSDEADTFPVELRGLFIQTTGVTTHFDAVGEPTPYHAADYVATGTPPPSDPSEHLLFAVLNGDQTDIPITLRQSFTLVGQGTLSGWAAFLGGDYQPFGDFGYVRLLDGDDNLLFSLFDGTIADPGYNATPWTFFSRDLIAGDYTIEAGIVNVGDGDQASRLIVDRFSVTAVPEPMTWALMLSGFFGMGAMLRRQRRPLAARIHVRRG